MGAARLPDAVRAFFADHRPPPGPGLVAVSGGADSVALLRALVEAGIGPLHVAYFHHHIREAEADAERELVEQLAEAVGGVFHSGDADVLAAGGNLEATARRLRYEWLTATAARTSAAWVATGHTADDQAETVLHRLLRGTGLRGLRGILAAQPLPPGPPLPGGEGGGGAPAGAALGYGTVVSQEESQCGHTLPPRGRGQGGGIDHAGAPHGNRASNVQLIRPLLAVTRADVLAYLATLGQPYCTDSSNADPRFTRNRLRAQVLPLLKTYNPDAAAALARAAGQAGEAFALIDRLAAELLARAELPRAGDLVVLDAAALMAADPLLAREAFRRLWEREGWPTGQLRAEHWHRLFAVAHGDPPAADFPGGISARRAGRVVRVGRRS